MALGKKVEKTEGLEELGMAPKKADSEAKIAFRALIESYKLGNPIKYEHKKEALFKKLETL